jgi:chromosome segregation ATPase
MRASESMTRAARQRDLGRYLLGVLVLVLAGSVGAQQAGGDDAARRSLARAQALLKQVNAQKVAAEAELAKLRVEAATLSAALAEQKAGNEQARAQLATTARRLAASERKGQNLDTRLERTAQRLRETRDSLATTRRDLQHMTAERDGLQASLTATRAELDDAERKNGELFRLAHQILDEYTAEGTFQRLFRSEGATGIRRVQLENLAQDYAGKLQDNLRPAARENAPAP